MNNSTKARFYDLHPDDQKITFDTYVQQQAIKYNIVLNAACKETGNKLVSEKAITAIIGNLASAATHTRISARKRLSLR